MVRLQSAISNLQIKAKSLISTVSHTSRQTKFLFGSAFALAFLIAPAAALMLSGAPTTNLNNIDATNSDTGGTTSNSNNGSSPAEQTPAASASDSSNSSQSENSSSSSTNVSVQSDNSGTTVNVNGQTVSTPADGNVSKVINDKCGHTVVIQNTSNSTGSTHTSTFSNSHVSSSGSNGSCP